MTTRREIVLLVTGFGRFPGAPFNPTEKIVAALGGAFARRLARLGVRLERRVLPVTWEGTPAALRRLEAELRPDAVLHLGLAARRPRVTAEIRAHNRNRPLSPDAGGARAPRGTIDPDAPPTAPSTVPLARLISAMARAAPSAASNDAGAYLCNLALWTSLRQGPAGRPVAFVHMPRPRGARARPGASSRPTLAALTRTAEIAVLELARTARAPRRPTFEQG
jgi:pyroglutamyl-peptidase